MGGSGCFAAITTIHTVNLGLNNNCENVFKNKNGLVMFTLRPLNVPTCILIQGLIADTRKMSGFFIRHRLILVCGLITCKIHVTIKQFKSHTRN